MGLAVYENRDQIKKKKENRDQMFKLLCNSYCIHNVIIIKQFNHHSYPAK